MLDQLPAAAEGSAWRDDGGEDDGDGSGKETVSGVVDDGSSVTLVPSFGLTGGA